jgi:ParB family chromosome partitioning protein
MAKRKRLSPAPAFEIPDPLAAPEGETGAKAHNGWVGVRSRAPIADVAGDAAQQSAFEEVAAELQSARQEGRMVLRVPLEAVDAAHLLRDRVAVDDDEMTTLMDSLRERGQQTPIEVVELGSGRFGLISGWRRLLALRTLHVEAPVETRFATVQALIRKPESAADAYRAMVEENEVRADLSFYERARIAIKSAEQGVYKSTKEAVQSLFSTARPAKRSKIMAFTTVVEALDGHLQFPEAIPEKLGLRLAQVLRDDPASRRRLSEGLRKASPIKTSEAERRVLERALSGGSRSVEAPEAIIPGLKLTAGSKRVVLSGTEVDSALVDDLKQWLRARA